ncbi:XTP/dITP diphosphatase [Lentibacillus saliphilus]|uniref:XTP/dITP diphosphatase n=1 Tax=Lentibacillus saliphilus TaxID=2737028 RepID=UPI001C2F47AB|nr:XTP/dITP diphosphatase [Lentibacillus saliphilus]
MKQIVVATKNAGKAVEFKDFFKTFGIEAVSLLDIEGPVDDIEETGHTFEENAAIKAEAIANLLGQTVIADDSGLEIDALDGRPGIYSARYAGESSTDAENVEKALKELDQIPAEERGARFVCVLAVATPGKETVYRTGFCEGHINREPKGENGFGYDPIFVPSGYAKTMAELSKAEKNAISHRKHAFDQLKDWIMSVQAEL